MFYLINLFDSEIDFEKDLFLFGWIEGGEEIFLVFIFFF